jgi:hypothetical protein
MNSLRCWCLVALLALPAASSHLAEGKVRILLLLLGDSTTIGSVRRRADPDGPHLEDVIRLLLAAEPRRTRMSSACRRLDGGGLLCEITVASPADCEPRARTGFTHTVPDDRDRSGV